MLSFKLLVALAITFCALALAAPLHLLFLARYPLVFIKGRWALGPALVDPTDLLIGVLLLAYLLRSRPAADSKRPRLPYLLPWLALGLLLSLSYLNAPGAQENLTSLHRVVYQLYRYGWKIILFLPLGLLLLDTRVKRERALFAIVLTGDLIALHTAIQVYGLGMNATGPFNHKNILAGSLVAPLLLSLIGAIEPRTRFRLFWLLSSVLIFRGLLFTGSRGAIVAFLAACCFCAACLLTRQAGRVRVIWIATAVLITGALVFVIKPDVLERPTVRKALTAQDGFEAATMQWRLEKRWPYFVDRIRENPWLGVGTDVDRELSAKGGASTPHNGYLTLAITYGVPAALLYCLMALFALRNGLRSFARSDDPWESALGLVLAASIVGILTHNMVDSTLRSPFHRDLYWILCAMSARGALLLGPVKSKVQRGMPGAAPLGTVRRYE